MGFSTLSFALYRCVILFIVGLYRQRVSAQRRLAAGRIDTLENLTLRLQLENFYDAPRKQRIKGSSVKAYWGSIAADNDLENLTLAYYDPQGSNA